MRSQTVLRGLGPIVTAVLAGCCAAAPLAFAGSGAGFGQPIGGTPPVFVDAGPPSAIGTPVAEVGGGVVVVDPADRSPLAQPVGPGVRPPAVFRERYDRATTNCAPTGTALLPDALVIACADVDGAAPARFAVDPGSPLAALAMESVAYARNTSLQNDSIFLSGGSTPEDRTGGKFYLMNGHAQPTDQNLTGAGLSFTYDRAFSSSRPDFASCPDCGTIISISSHDSAPPEPIKGWGPLRLN